MGTSMQKDDDDDDDDDDELRDCGDGDDEGNDDPYSTFARLAPKVNDNWALHQHTSCLHFCWSHEIAIKLCDPLGSYGTALPRNGVQQLVKSEFSVFPSQVSQHAA